MRIVLLFFISLVILLEGNRGMSQSQMLGKDSLLLMEKGMASYYGKAFHKRKTASGEIFDMHANTAAHKHLPFGTLVKVTKIDNGYQVIVKVNDRLPQNSKRIIDLSWRSAQQLDMIQQGIAPVKLYALSFGGMRMLLDYYEKIPEGLRLRLYYQPVSWTKTPKPNNALGEDYFREIFNLVGIYSLY